VTIEFVSVAVPSALTLPMDQWLCFDNNGRYNNINISNIIND
jgi:hypothetical protein